MSLFYQQKYFCGYMNSKISPGQLISHAQKPQVFTQNNRIFRDILVHSPNDTENAHIEKSESAVVSKVVHTVDNMGQFVTFYQFGKKASDMSLKVSGVHIE